MLCYVRGQRLIISVSSGNTQHHEYEWCMVVIIIEEYLFQRRLFTQKNGYSLSKIRIVTVVPAEFSTHHRGNPWQQGAYVHPSSWRYGRWRSPERKIEDTGNGMYPRQKAVSKANQVSDWTASLLALHKFQIPTCYYQFKPAWPCIPACVPCQAWLA